MFAQLNSKSNLPRRLRRPPSLRLITRYGRSANSRKNHISGKAAYPGVAGSRDIK
jgi:hypothetical protein